MELPDLSREEKSQILALSLGGVKNPEISAKLGMSIRTVQRILKGWKQYKTIKAAPKSGRKRKVSAEIESRLIKLKTTWPQKLTFRTLRLKSWTGYLRV
jgi:transposase